VIALKKNSPQVEIKNKREEKRPHPEEGRHGVGKGMKSKSKGINRASWGEFGQIDITGAHFGKARRRIPNRK